MPPKTTRCTYLARLSELLNPGRANLGLEIWILRILRGHNHCFWCKNLRQKQTVLQMKRSGLEKRKNNAQVRDLFFLAAFWLLITKIFSTESIYLYTPPPPHSAWCREECRGVLVQEGRGRSGGDPKTNHENWRMLPRNTRSSKYKTASEKSYFRKTSAFLYNKNEEGMRRLISVPSKLYLMTFPGWPGDHKAFDHTQNVPRNVNL